MGRPPSTSGVALGVGTTVGGTLGDADGSSVAVGRALGMRLMVGVSSGDLLAEGDGEAGPGLQAQSATLTSTGTMAGHWRLTW